MKKNNKTGNFDIKASLSSNQYVTVKISADSTLSDLADLILDGVGFDHSHLYSFFMNNVMHDKSEEYTIFPDDDTNVKLADKTRLSELGIKEGHLFRFLYDFGDEWEFSCCVLGCSDEPAKENKVTEVYGEMPEQYPDYDEDDEEDDDEDFELTEEECEEQRNLNSQLLDVFEKSLSSLTAKTRNGHLNNVDFYINEFLLGRCCKPYDHGAYCIDDFLGYFFIRKCMWSTPASIKSTAASIKKFYKCMMDNNRLDPEDYSYLCDEIKENMDYWQDTCAQYNDPELDNPFAFF